MNVVINRGGARYAKSGPCEEGRGWGGGEADVVVTVS